MVYFVSQVRGKRDLYIPTLKETFIEREVRDQYGSDKFGRMEEEIGRWQANKQAQQHSRLDWF